MPTAQCVRPPPTPFLPQLLCRGANLVNRPTDIQATLVWVEHINKAHVNNVTENQIPKQVTLF